MANKKRFCLNNGFSLVVEGDWYNYFGKEGSIIETGDVSLYVEKNHKKYNKEAEDEKTKRFKLKTRLEGKNGNL